MINLLEVTMMDFKLFLLILFRISGMMMLVPVLGSDSVPIKVKIAFSLLLAAMLFPLLGETHQIIPPDNLGAYVVAAGSELALGMLIGFAANLLFVGVQLAGMLIGQEMGISLANVIDPITNSSISVISQLKFFVAVMVFLAINGHHWLLTGLIDSFTLVPVMTLSTQANWMQLLADQMAGGLFTIGLKLAAPAMVTLFLTTISMGFLARTVPEMNIFVLGFALRIGVGVVVLWLTFPAFAWLFVHLSTGFSQGLTDFIRLMGP